MTRGAKIAVMRTGFAVESEPKKPVQLNTVAQSATRPQPSLHRYASATRLRVAREGSSVTKAPARSGIPWESSVTMEPVAMVDYTRQAGETLPASDQRRFDLTVAQPRAEDPP